MCAETKMPTEDWLRGPRATEGREVLLVVSCQWSVVSRIWFLILLLTTDHQPLTTATSRLSASGRVTPSTPTPPIQLSRSCFCPKSRALIASKSQPEDTKSAGQLVRLTRSIAATPTQCGSFSSVRVIPNTKARGTTTLVEQIRCRVHSQEKVVGGQRSVVSRKG